MPPIDRSTSNKASLSLLTSISSESKSTISESSSIAPLKLVKLYSRDRTPCIGSPEVALLLVKGGSLPGCLPVSLMGAPSSRRQTMLGLGWPAALHWRFTFECSVVSTTWLLWAFIIEGGTVLVGVGPASVRTLQALQLRGGMLEKEKLHSPTTSR